MEMTSLLNYDLFNPIMENLPLAVLLIDQDYQCIYCNTLFLTMSGLNSEQVSGMNWSRFLSFDQQNLLFRQLAGMNDPRKSHHLTQQPDHTGEAVSTWSVVKGNDGHVGEFFLITFTPKPDDLKLDDAKPRKNDSMPDSIENVGSIKWQSKDKITGSSDLEKINTELNLSNRLKDKVLSVIAHDVRAPIASLKGLTSTLLDTNLDNQEKALLREDLLKQLSAVADLTENILLWATNSFTKTKSETKETLHIIDVVEANRSVIEQQAHSKNIKVTYEIPAHLKICVNKDQFNMVIRNLATNAIKYTPANGHIAIIASISNSCVHISITDNGIGISEEHQKSLFSFSQTSTYGTDGEKGIGLGLLLCKEYVEANDGKISVYSKLNSGTTVVTEFPAVP